MTKKLVSLVIPCFNEELVLDELFKRTGAAIAGIKDKDLNFEVIMVDDGSRVIPFTNIKK
jgi:glycosyltransferase involved in cell wall biosynthesis